MRSNSLRLALAAYLVCGWCACKRSVGEEAIHEERSSVENLPESNVPEKGTNEVRVEEEVVHEDKPSADAEVSLESQSDLKYEVIHQEILQSGEQLLFVRLNMKVPESTLRHITMRLGRSFPAQTETFAHFYLPHVETGLLRE